MSSPTVAMMGATIVPPAKQATPPDVETEGMTPNQILAAYTVTGPVTHNIIPPPLEEPPA